MREAFLAGKYGTGDAAQKIMAESAKVLFSIIAVQFIFAFCSFSAVTVVTVVSLQLL